MKKLIYILLMTSVSACHTLDLNPLSEASTATFYSNQTELELAVNDLYRITFWGNDNELFSDNEWHRAQLTNAVIGGTMNADDVPVQTYWLNSYKAIARANSFLANKDKAAASTPAAILLRLEAEMRLIRAYQYARLITHFGDVPLMTEPVTLDESYGIARTSQEEVLAFVFAELDFAVANLPVTYGAAEVKRLTKGPALAVKARTALHLGKWQIAKEASEAVMKLATYSLHDSYSQLFVKAGESSKELIISIPRDEKQQVFGNTAYVQDNISRNAGGYGAQLPTRDLMDAYECVDGKLIDESPLYDPKMPFKNRDPRLNATIVEFNTQWLGYNYTPHPDSLTIFSVKENKKVPNKDTRAVAAFASFTGFLWKKGIDQTWPERLVEDNDAIIIRYAEMLLSYAEAKIELGEIDETVVNAINQVRARAYGVTVDKTTAYPAIKLSNAAALRQILRRERRVEFPREGLRYMDLIRWKLAEKVLVKPVIGLPDPAAQNRAKWPFPGVTPIDADGIADYSGFGTDVKVIAQRNFDKTRQYFWPIPAVERRVNPGITQNTGY
ncbi:RagB/SusD family nutrient uptake outer membrane protein [Dyadobacter chenhuakuii]|uniref:RagB/SusD family nutrient uptake outer membrane protein n=1 Tax=Dyadobacter chenhuakuii TaxID=2909339 RepID=A0ABY4XPA7_9BACT|nr:RagB/SusD family nutrient uptake outer membrane protein [Dyadobacter chenhuakuii]MCF2494441.1 RagB/SusD family nutrient uptake outer membrane protein [Dyadobacter chenhuakuii]USJ32233.1 RagB/SusD family nutrient uptake outer membrane protein [Dyadobacter chenhuakuii]